jgi:hypothetical protein
MRNFLLHSYFRSAILLFFLILACSCGNTCAAGTPSEYLKSFDPAKGFKPAQRDLTEIFLQIAGSLEHHGSPVPYLRHVATEHTRVEALYRQELGTVPKSFRPAYMTDDYLDRLAANWTALSPKLGLDPLARDIGHMMRDAIKGTRGTGTILVEIFNRHQARIFDSMAGKKVGRVDYDSLRAELVSRLELDKKQVDEERYEIARRDAVSFALGIQGVTRKLFARLDAGLAPADAAKVKTVLMSIFDDVGRMAESELQAGILEWSVKASSSTAK